MKGEEPRPEWATVISKRTKRRAKAQDRKKEKQQVQQLKTSSAEVADGRKVPAKNRRTKAKAEALLIKPAPGRSYAEVLGDLRKKAKSKDSETEIQTIRQTRSDGILLELGAKIKNKPFFEVIRGILGEKAVVSALEPKCTL